MMLLSPFFVEWPGDQGDRQLTQEINDEPDTSFYNIDQETLQREEENGKPKLEEIFKHNTTTMNKSELRALHKQIGRRRMRSTRSGNDNKKEELTSEKPPKKKKKVKCKDHSEDKCKSELEAAGTTILHDIKGTKYFSVLVDEEEELTVGALNDVEGIEDDPERSLSYIREEEEEEEESVD
jgi:hypothetical protein